MTRRAKVLFLIVWSAIVLPLLPLGYGSDGDAWLVARAALRIWTERQYVASRSMGFPLFEIVSTPLVHFGGWTLSNLFPAVAGLAGILALFHLVDRGHFRFPVLAVSAVAFLPVFVKNSASTMDYVPALALLLWAYVAMIDGRLDRCSILVGLACGFRPTSGLMIISVAAYLLRAGETPRRVLRQTLLATVCGILAYSPVLLCYGLRDPYGSFHLDARTRLMIGGYNALTLLGIPQSILVAGVLAWGLRAERRSVTGLATPLGLFHAANILTWITLFAFLPEEPEYLMPLLPSVAWWLDRLAARRTFQLTVAALLCYHVVRLDALGGESGSRRIEWAARPGYTIADVQDRIFKLSTRRAAGTYFAERPTVLMLGDPWVTTCNDEFVFDDALQMFRQRNGRLYISGRILDEEKLKRLSGDGFRLVVFKAEKWEFVRGVAFDWRSYVEVIDDLGAFFGETIRGRAITDS
jgi:hypothetical protein